MCGATQKLFSLARQFVFYGLQKVLGFDIWYESMKESTRSTGQSLFGMRHVLYFKVDHGGYLNAYLVFTMGCRSQPINESEFNRCKARLLPIQRL